MIRTVIDLIATGCYSGRSPKAPGTVGTVAAAFIVYLSTFIWGEWYVGRAGFLVAIIFTAIAIVAAEGALKLGIYGERGENQGKCDPQQIVIDEWVGYLVAIAVPIGGSLTLILGFVLFRIFDIFKPPPVSTAERLPGGWGIVLDDFVAGVLANIVIRIVYTLL